MFEPIKKIVRDLKVSGQWKEVLLYSFFWMIISVLAAYPALFMQDGGVYSILYPKNVDDYQAKLVLPFALFFTAFIFDFCVSTKNVQIGYQREQLYKCLLLMIVCIAFLIVLSITIRLFDARSDLAFYASYFHAIRYTSLALLWIVICIIKGLTILISWSDENQLLTQPSKNII